MARGGDSPTGAPTAAGLAAQALTALAVQRGGVDHPSLYARADHPWTDQLARLLRAHLSASLGAQAAQRRRHVVAAHWRAPALLEPGPVEAARNPVYDIAWRVYAADCARLAAQPLIAECAWRGGWAVLAPACDRLAQGLADLRLLCATADPNRSVGDMTLAQACAYRVAAFAPKDARVFLAFYGGRGGWRATPGFSIYTHVCGARAVKPLA